MSVPLVPVATSSLPIALRRRRSRFRVTDPPTAIRIEIYGPNYNNTGLLSEDAKAFKASFEEIKKYAAMPQLLKALDLTGALLGLGLILLIRPAAGLLSLVGLRQPTGPRLVVAFYGGQAVMNVFGISLPGLRIEW